MAKCPNWTKEEIDYLMSVWQNTSISIEDICHKLNRNRRTISAKARRLGLSRGNSIFTEEEINTLKQNYANMSNSDLQEKYFPDKTVYQITNAGSNLNLKKSAEYLKIQQVEIGVKNLKAIESQKGENSPKWVERVIVYCSFCGVEMSKTKAKTKTRNYCSRECLYKHRTILSLGENNPNWNGGISDLKAYGREVLTQWKKDSMASCGYKCVISGEKFSDIHHIKSYDEIFYEALVDLDLVEKQRISDYSEQDVFAFRDKIIEVHYKYPLGVCLSREIHEEFHKRYGRKNASMDNWYEFYAEKSCLHDNIVPSLS